MNKMLRLASYLKPYRKEASLAPLLMMIEVLTDLIQPLLMAKIVDQGIYNGDVAFIIKTGALMVGAALIGMGGGVGSVVYSSIASQNMAADLRSDLFEKVQSFSFDNLDQFKTSSLITRLTNDVVQVQHVVLAMLRIMVRAPLLCIGGIVMTLLINPGLALILLVTIPVLAAALYYVIKKGFPLFAEVQKKLDRVNAVVRENLTGVRVVKAFVRADYEKRRFGEANRQLMDITVQASRLVGLIMPIMFLLMNLSIVAVIWFGGFRVNNGNMLVGEVMAFINYMVQILFSLMMLAFILMMVSRAKASADRIQEVLDARFDLTEAPQARGDVIREGYVSFEHVSFRYKRAGGTPVLRDITFSARPGETVAILGSTGSGKTTLVNLIPRFYDVTAGRVLIDGVDVRELKMDSVRNSIGMVFQESILFSGTIRENIRWGKKDAGDEEIMEAARAAQAHDFIMELPQGYDTVIGQRGVNLSGGQKQRLTIARALIKKPLILVLDDSTSSVDLATEARIHKAFKKMPKTAIFIIAQRISSVLEADQILVLDDGQIAAQGTHRELLGSSPVYREIYDSQLEEEAV